MKDYIISSYVLYILLSNKITYLFVSSSDFVDSNFVFIEMLFKCNYLAVVGGGQNADYPSNKGSIL